MPEPNVRSSSPESQLRSDHDVESTPSTPPQRPQNQYWPPYLNYIRTIAAQFPHYNILLEDSLFPNKLDVVALDVFANSAAPPIQARLKTSRDLRRLLSNHDEGSKPPSGEKLKTRFLFIEDLSRSTIEVLGAELDLPLDFFAMHLDGSIYRDNDAVYRKRFLNSSGLDPTAVMYSVPWRRVVGSAASLTGIDPVLSTARCSNILRHCESLDCRIDTSSSQVPAAVCERVTFLRRKVDSCDTVVVIFDPLFEAEINPYACKQDVTIMRPPDSQVAPEILSNRNIFRCSPFVNDLPRNFPGVPTFKKFDQYNNDDCFTTKQHDGYVHIIQSKIRNQGTRSALLSFLEGQGAGFYDEPSALELAVFGAIANDWTLVITALSESLDHVDEGLANGELVSSNHERWQTFLCLCRKNMAVFRAEIGGALVEVKALAERSHQSSDPLVRRVVSEFTTLDKNARELHERCERSFSALMASMSILESRKSIAQAASVNRLSEMAYIFIPLTYVASIFSMQIKEFDGRLDIKAWCLLSVFLTMATYGIRIVNRSSSFSSIRKWIRDSARRSGNYSTSQTVVRSRDYFRFLWKNPVQVYVKVRNSMIGGLSARTGTFLRAIVALGLVAAVYAVWTHTDIRENFKTAVTITLGSVLVFLVGGYVIAAVHRVGRETRPLRAWELKALFVVQAARWTLLLQANLLVLPVFLIWSEATSVPLGGQVVITIIALVIASLLTLRCCWEIFSNIPG